MRLEANPHLVRAELADGHTVLGHSWDHPNLNNIPASTLAFEIADTAARFDALGAPYTFKVVRPPFLSVNAATTAALAAMGFAVTPNPISATDWDPARSAHADRHGIAQRAAARASRSCSTTDRSTPPPARRRSTRCR